MAVISKDIAVWRNNRRMILAVLSAGHGISHWFDHSFPVLLPSITASLRLSNLQVGAIGTAKEVSVGLMNVPAGFVVDMLKVHWGLILTGCLIWIGVAHGLAGISPNYPFLVVMLVLVSVPGALWHLPATAALSQRFPDWRGFAISIHGFGANIGNLIGPIVAGALLLIFSWRGVLFLYVVPALTFALILWFFLKDLGRDQGPESRRNIKVQLREAARSLRKPVVVGLITVSLLRGMALNALLIWTPFYLTDEIGKSSVSMGVHMALLAGTGVVSTPLLGVLSDRYNRKLILIPSLALGAILSALVVSAGSGLWLTLVIAAMGLFSYGISQIFQAAMLDHVSRGTEASTTGILFGTNAALGAFSPLIVVALISAFDLGSVFFYAAGLTTASLLLLLPIPLRVGPTSA